MATLSVDGANFYVLPETASWSYSMHIQSFDTYDGRVIQLLACNVDSLSIEGFIPSFKVIGSSPTSVSSNPADRFRDQWAAMEAFEANVKRIMQAHERGGRALSANGKSSPAHFSFPEVGWDGDVYLVGYSDVRYEPGTAAVKYTLRFEIDSGFSTIADAAGVDGFKNIPDGVGWVRSIYNTPAMGAESWSKLKSALEAIVDDADSFDASKPADFLDYLQKSESGELDEDSDEKKTDGDKDSDFTTKAKTEGVVSATVSTVNDKLVSLGLVAAPKKK